MLTCKQFLEELNEYLDQTADGELRQRLEAHITKCPNCWVICDTTKKTLQVYKGMTLQNVPDYVQTRLLAALERKMADKGNPKT